MAAEVTPAASPVATLAPEQVVRAIVNVLVQREVLVKAYRPIEEIEAENCKRRQRDPKAKLEELPPKPREGDWWDNEVYTDGWVESELFTLHRLLDPTVLHQDTILWFKEVIAANGRPAFRYCFRAAPPLTLDALRSKLLRHLAYMYEVERPALGKQLLELRKRVTDMEKIVFYGAEHVLDLIEYQEEEEAEGAEEEEGGSASEGDSKKEDTATPPRPPTRVQVLAKLLRFQEGRIRELEAERMQMVHNAKNVSESLSSINSAVQLLRAKVEGVRPEDGEKKTEEEIEREDEKEETREKDAKQRARNPAVRQHDQRREADKKKEAARRRVAKVLAEKKKKNNDKEEKP